MVAEFEGQITKCRREGKDIKISCVLKNSNTYEAEIIFKTIDFENPLLNEKYFRTGKNITLIV